MSSDFIKLHPEVGGPFYVNAYRVNVVDSQWDEDGTVVYTNVRGQEFHCTETPEEVVAMIDKVVNGSDIGSVPLSRTFPGMDKP